MALVVVRGRRAIRLHSWRSVSATTPAPSLRCFGAPPRQNTRWLHRRRSLSTTTSPLSSSSSSSSSSSNGTPRDEEASSASSAPSSRPGGLRVSLRKEALDRRQLRAKESRRAMHVLGGALVACGGSTLTFAHGEAVLALMRDLDVVGSVLLAAGVTVAVAPSVRDFVQSQSAFRRQLRSLQMQLSATQRAVDGLARDLALPTADGTQLDDDDDKFRPGGYYAPSRVLHVRGVQPDMTPQILHELHDLFVTLGAPPEKIITVGRAKSQALAQFASVDVASDLLGKFDGGLLFKERLIFASYSMWPELIQSKHTSNYSS